jgi:hypothetical protein
VARSPPNSRTESAEYRSASPGASAWSPDNAASTRGSSWAASAATRRHPGSARTAGRRARGICRAPPPRVAQRPDTTPPTTYSGRNRPPSTQLRSHDHPCAECSLASSLYASRGSTAGWSICRSSHDRVVCSSWPTRANARNTSAGESGLSARPPNAATTSSASACSFGGRPPSTGRGPSRSVSSRSCTSARHGSPWQVISSATSIPADSAAARSRIPGAAAARACCCAACTATRSASSSVAAAVSNKAGGPSPASGGSGSGVRPSSLATAAARPCGSPKRPAAPTRSPSTSSTSWARATCTPAASSRR